MGLLAGVETAPVAGGATAPVGSARGRLEGRFKLLQARASRGAPARTRAAAGRRCAEPGSAGGHRRRRRRPIRASRMDTRDAGRTWARLGMLPRPPRLFPVAESIGRRRRRGYSVKAASSSRGYSVKSPAPSPAIAESMESQAPLAACGFAAQRACLAFVRPHGDVINRNAKIAGPPIYIFVLMSVLCPSCSLYVRHVRPSGHLRPSGHVCPSRHVCPAFIRVIYPCHLSVSFIRVFF